MSVADYVFYLVFFISINQVRGWPREVGAMSTRFAIRGQQGRVEDIMDGPGLGQVELIGHG
jgi:hypothetical protein